MFIKYNHRSLIRGLCAPLFLLCLSTSMAEAREIKNLYQAEVPVKTQQLAERLEVYPAALSQVIVKISGDRTTPMLPQLAGTIAGARRLVQQFHYRDLPEEGYLALKEEGYKHLLVMEFDGQTLTQDLVKGAVPLWGRTRPELLLWLAVEDREARYLLAANASHELESSIRETSSRRGLPIMLPLLDLEDRMQLGFADVWGDFRQSIINASERYGADAVLVGRLYRPAKGPWQVRWSLYQQNDTQHWQDENTNQALALEAGIEAAIDSLARNYAQLLTAESAGQIELRVTDVNDLAGYARAMRYLESLDVVSRVEVTSVFSDEVLFRLDVRGEVGGLKQAIALGGTLRPVTGVQSVAGHNRGDVQSFVYQLQP